YCRWRGERDGRRYRLPSDEEWEKAARGTDARIFPWGDRYDASFCKNSGSTADRAQPEPVGAYRTDCSPYGVRDMAGTIREWCRSWFEKKDKLRLVRGGSWNFDRIGAHAAYRVGCPPGISYPFIGFRLVHRPEKRSIR
ncbi:MAG: SUMF1/EgtB/PvdO family nonheme iron enzyme, partial [Planctomycetes bacterium]|nr:SUMF1/EgtB/PvdO family nonheme iron enzyme [Planctomycetota bacterium]